MSRTDSVIIPNHKRRFHAPMNFRRDNPMAGPPLPSWRIDWTFTGGPVNVHRYALRSTESLSGHRPPDFWFSV